MRTVHGLLLAALLSAALVGMMLLLRTAVPLIAAQAVSQASQNVTIEDFSFQPQELTVPISTTVTWTNADSAGHTTTSTTDVWDSGVLSGADNSFTLTFTQTGTFNYICTIHPGMMGVVNVVETQDDSRSRTLLPMVQR
jgi:plastocyanin